jgi:hypothetical protein
VPYYVIFLEFLLYVVSTYLFFCLSCCGLLLARLFDELRRTKRAGIFGVAFSSNLLYDRCVVDPDTGKVSKILGWTNKFKYPIDMGGFSVHTYSIRGARFHHEWPSGSLESNFLNQIVDKVEDLEPLANNCTSIYAWHVKTMVGNKKPRTDDQDYERIALSV